MPTLIRILTPDGLEPAPFTGDSLADAARHEPHDGVYTITNTLAAPHDPIGVLRFDAHLDRLESSAARAGIAFQPDRARLRAALRSLIEAAGWGAVRFRITVPAASPDRPILSIEPFRPLSADVYAHGVRCITVPGSHRKDPEAKTIDWVHDRAAIEAALPPGTFTGLLLDGEGRILEGLSSNFYAVFPAAAPGALPTLWTAGGGVLAGIAQGIVLAVAPGVVEIRREAPFAHAVDTAAEAFITSASRGIVPVVAIDDRPISGGVPGPVTAQLRERYARWVVEHVEAL